MTFASIKKWQYLMSFVSLLVTKIVTAVDRDTRSPRPKTKSRR